MSFEKNGMVTPDSHSDFDSTKKAEYYDEEGTGIADESNKNKLRRPKRIEEIEPVFNVSKK